jgi:hypothetical protein
MYTRHAGGLLELEVGDWKEARRYRIMALDQGRLSFVDLDYRAGETNTAILILNPKDPLFFSNSENWEDLKRTQHVRILVFSEGAVARVAMTIDRDAHEVEMSRTASRDLFTCPWNPRLYDRSLHLVGQLSN